MGSRGQAAGGVWREISPKAEVLAQVGYLCGLPGKLLAPPRPCAEDRSFTSPRVISPSSPLRLRFSPDSLLGSAGARGVEYTPITHSRMEKQTQEGWGGRGTWQGGHKPGHVTGEAAAQAESRTFQGRNTVTLGMLRDSETLSKGSPRRGSSCQSLLCGLALCPSTSFYAHASSSEGGSGCPGPSSPACFSLLVSTDPGLFPSTDRYMPKRR